MIPAPKLEQDFYDWYRRHADALRLKGQIDPEVVLIGDSITHMWAGRPTEIERFRRGVDSWAETFGDRALNLGFGWDRTQNVLWRIDHGELDELTPHTTVIHIGTNNLAGTSRHQESTPEQVVAGIKAITERVRTKLPQTKIVLMAVFPRGEQPTDPKRLVIARVNELLKPVAEELGVTYLDLTDQFVEPDGTITRRIMGDFLHPAADGYAIWAKALKPTLDQNRRGE